MKLLIITQKVDQDDPVLGFFHRWIEEFAKTCEQVIVICLYKGENNFQENVRVLSLGKEEGESRVKYLVRFFSYIVNERGNYNSVFVHMNFEYVVLGGMVWNTLGKRIVLWYAHGAKPAMLYVATFFAQRIVTSTKDGYRIQSSKKSIVGQGIDVVQFKPRQTDRDDGVFKMVIVGRISPVKDYETLLRATAEAKKDLGVFELKIVGGPGQEDQEKYFESLKDLSTDLGLDNQVVFTGPKRHDEIPDLVEEADIFVSTSNTGSLDKASVEAMAVGVPVIACNTSIAKIIETVDKKLIFESGNISDLRDKMLYLVGLSASDRSKIGLQLRDKIASEHGLERLILLLKKELQ